MQVSNLRQNVGHDVAEFASRSKSRHDRPHHEDNDLKAPNSASDYVFLNNIRPEKAREFLHSRISRSIAEVAPQNHARQPAFTRNFPDAATTASHIIDNVNSTANAVSQDGNGDLQAIVEKIQEGFQLAKESLEKLNVLSQGFGPEFDDIQQRVNSFLDGLQSSQPVTQITEVSASHESYQTSSQASIQIETRDGDIVTIDLSNSFNQSQTSASLNSNNFSGYAYEAFSENSNSLQFTVSGELDENELNAISNLVGDIAKTVGQFEKGNVNAALNIAKNIDRQSEELSGFSFNVQTSEQYRAIDLYQKTQVTTSEPLPAPETAPTALAEESNVESALSNNVSNIIYAAESANILEAAATVNDIFDKFYEQLDLLSARFETLTEQKEEHEETES